MNAQVHARQQAQLAFATSDQPLIVGDVAACPLPPAELAALTTDSPLVVEHFGGGLTARVLHLCIDGEHYTLKQKRAEALVRNIDGETSFLNEVQRRAEDGANVDGELLDTIRMIAAIMGGMKEV